MVGPSPDIIVAEGCILVSSTWFMYYLVIVLDTVNLGNLGKWGLDSTIRAGF